AKVINFGLLYGMNQFGLADRLGVSQAEAIDIMTRYFDALPGVKKYLDEITNQALAIGYAETLWGRVRPVNEINAKGQALKRVLINSPIQGTAADITRRAMLKLDKAINNKNINLFLQVHDSLVCECAPESIDDAGEILRKNMEEAAELSLPLNVNIKTGSSLAEV
ncbi:MAG: DNA polymerase I, partial [Synergistaceae bacterium]|nr:DNA polymerase I [Synergistaceae bacterium]